MRGAQPNHSAALLGTSLTRAALALVVIACGLSLRGCGFPLGLPAFVVKYGGSLLWATMVYLLVGVLLPRLTRGQLATIAAVIAVVVEFSRLVHVPWLDAFGLTTARANLLAVESGGVCGWDRARYLAGPPLGETQARRRLAKQLFSGGAENISRQFGIAHGTREHDRSDQRGKSYERILIALALPGPRADASTEPFDHAVHAGGKSLSRTLGLALHFATQGGKGAAASRIVSVRRRKIFGNIIAGRCRFTEVSSLRGDCRCDGFLDKPLLGAELAVEAAVCHTGGFRQSIDADARDSALSDQARSCR